MFDHIVTASLLTPDPRINAQATNLVVGAFRGLDLAKKWKKEFEKASKGPDGVQIITSLHKPSRPVDPNFLLEVLFSGAKDAGLIKTSIKCPVSGKPRASENFEFPSRVLVQVSLDCKEPRGRINLVGRCGPAFKEVAEANEWIARFMKASTELKGLTFQAWCTELKKPEDPKATVARFFSLAKESSPVPHDDACPTFTKKEDRPAVMIA